MKLKPETQHGVSVKREKSASSYPKNLGSIGILQREKRGRETVCKHPALIEALTQQAEPRNVLIFS